jgi:hypothetical protein
VIKDGKIATEAWHVCEGSLAKLKSALAELMPAEPKVETPVESPVSDLAITITIFQQLQLVSANGDRQMGMERLAQLWTV